MRKFVTVEEFKQAARAGAVDGLALRKQYLAEVRQVEEGERVLEFTISTGEVDRDRDTIAPEGWKLENYQRNPVVLFAHDYTSPPVARALATWLEGGRLKSRAEFTPRELYPFGYMVYELYRHGFMRAASVGFLPVKWTFSEDRKFGVDFVEQELLEWSCVPVPSNPSALVDAGAKGIDTGPLLEWATRVLDEWTEERGIWIPRSKAEEIARMLGRRVYAGIPVDHTHTANLTGHAAVEKGAISYGRAHPNGTPLAPEDEEWDGPAEVAAAEVDDLKVMCTWVDSDNPDIKSSYKLPHHKARGEHACVWRGVAAAMARLMQGRTQIPDEDRRGCYNHLARHYREFDKEPPEFRSYNLDDPEEALALLAACFGLAGPAPHADAKSGRVLSRANEERIRKAVDLLNEVLAQLEAEPESGEDEGSDGDKDAGGESPPVLLLADDKVADEGQPKVNVDEQTLRDMVLSAMRDAVTAITGRVD